MKNKYRNIFLAFGIIAVLIMIFTFDMDYRELWVNLKRAGIYLPLVLLLWLFVYLINTLSWYIIIRSGGKPGFSFSRLYKFTVTGFALNYVTPVGLMGGVQQAVAIDFICLRLQPELIDDEIDKAECSGNQTENGKNGCFSTHKNTSSKQWESLLPL